jgi:hypothetical protein
MIDAVTADLNRYLKQVDEDEAFDAAVEREVEELMEMKLCEFLSELYKKIDITTFDDLVTGVARDRVIARSDEVDEPDEPDDVVWDWDGDR